MSDAFKRNKKQRIFLIGICFFYKIKSEIVLYINKCDGLYLILLLVEEFVIFELTLFFERERIYFYLFFFIYFFFAHSNLN